MLWNGAPVDDPATFMTPPRCAYTAQTPRLFTESLRDNILMGLDAPTRRSWSRPCGWPCWRTTSSAGRGPGDRWSAPAASPSPAARCSGPPRRGCSPASRSCWCSTTPPAPWTSAPSTPSGSACSQSGEHTCLAVSHRLEAYRHAHEILLLDDGRVAARGNLRELLRDSPLFREVWHETSHAARRPTPRNRPSRSLWSGCPQRLAHPTLGQDSFGTQRYEHPAGNRRDRRRARLRSRRPARPVPGRAGQAAARGRQRPVRRGEGGILPLRRGPLRRARVHPRAGHSTRSSSPSSAAASAVC